MNWLARLKNKAGSETDATKPTEPGFVGFVAYSRTPIENSHPKPSSLPGDCANDKGCDIASLRQNLFMDRGLSSDDAQALVDRLAVRDSRGDDDRRVCLECLHLSGTVTSRLCGKWHKLGNSSLTAVADLADILQRCVGFQAAHLNGGKTHA